MCTAIIRASLVPVSWVLSCAGAVAANWSGNVVGVSDGDTLTVLVDRNPVHVRVAGIDAPEKGQPFSQASKHGLAACALGRSVAVEWQKKDRYGRTVGKVLVGTVDCGLRQIEQGFAWHYKSYAREQNAIDRESYSSAEDAAREAKVGLWEHLMPVAPWEYRKLRRPAVVNLKGMEEH